MAWPTVAVNTTNLDQSTDSPATARADLLDLVQKVNQMISQLSAGMNGTGSSIIGNNTGNGTTNYFPLLVGDGNTSGGGTNQTFVRLGRNSAGIAMIDAFQGGVGASPLAFGGYGTEWARFDSNGNFGLNAVPNPWAGTAGKALQINNLTIGQNIGSDVSVITTNGYATGGGTYAYIVNASATQYLQYAGRHFFNTSSSGTAGNPITFTQSLAVGKGTTLALEGASTVTGTGISFPATANLSSDPNTLDNYLEASFTLTASVGLTTTPTGTCNGVRVGNKVTLDLPTLNGVSNSATFTITGSPTPFRPTTSPRAVVCRVQDNGNGFMGFGYLDSSGNMALGANLISNSNFTTTGNKALLACSISYTLY